jgi:GDP-4-dehydro-6-deoxy-D-mannose reductase
LNILITGAAGFLAGPTCREALHRWPRARVFRSDLRPEPGIRPCDLLEPESARRLVAASRPDLVFHLAGMARSADPGTLWRAHVTTTINLMEALQALRTRTRVVLSGSSAEYGAARGVVTERTPPDPVTDYGRSKHCQTLAALSFRHEGLEVLIARIFNVAGPGTPEWLAPGAFAGQIADIARKGGSGRPLSHQRRSGTPAPETPGSGRPLSHQRRSGTPAPETPGSGRVLTGNLAAERDYLDVRDAAAALAAIARHGRDGEVYNVCSGRTIAMADLLQKMIAASGRRISVVRDPARWRPVDVRRLAGSQSKLTTLCGWKPSIPLEESLAATLRSRL